MTSSTDKRFQGLGDGAILAFAYVAVAVSLFIGALFLYEGLGLDFRILDYPVLKTYGVPIGLLSLGLGVATARLWIFNSDGADDGRRETPPPSSAPRRGMSRARFVPPPAAANENRATKISTPNVGARNQTGARSSI